MSQIADLVQRHLEGIPDLATMDREGHLDELLARP